MRFRAPLFQLTQTLFVAVLVGVYSNRVVTGEHATGYTLQLWEEAGRTFGFFLSSRGLAEDPPIGVLDDLKYNPQDRTLSFKSKLSIGVITTADGEYVPSQDLYQFEGTLFPNQVSGQLLHLNGLQPNSAGRSEEIKLYRSKKDEAALAPIKSYEDWKEVARQLLQARGPKW